jgi:hypothetical protein
MHLNLNQAALQMAYTSITLTTRFELASPRSTGGCFCTTKLRQHSIYIFPVLHSRH